jgi:hypothetical protein
MNTIWKKGLWFIFFHNKFTRAAESWKFLPTSPTLVLCPKVSFNWLYCIFPNYYDRDLFRRLKRKMYLAAVNFYGWPWGGGGRQTTNYFQKEVQTNVRISVKHTRTHTHTHTKEKSRPLFGDAAYFFAFAKHFFHANSSPHCTETGWWVGGRVLRDI